MLLSKEALGALSEASPICLIILSDNSLQEDFTVGPKQTLANGYIENGNIFVNVFCIVLSQQGLKHESLVSW